MYDELFEVWRKETENVEVQMLSKDFYLRLADYVKKMREERRMLDERTVKGKLLQKEEQNVLRMTEELIRRRYEKMMHLVVNGEIVPAAALTEEEEAFYKEASVQSDSYQSFLKGILQGRLSKERSSKTHRLVVVRILREMPKIIGADMRTYGPFKPEDIATLPEENAKILIKQAAATEIETK